MAQIRWIDPSDKITDANERGRARVLILLLLVRLLALSGMAIYYWTHHEPVGGGNVNSARMVMTSVCVINLIAYLLSLSRFYKIAWTGIKHFAWNHQKLSRKLDHRYSMPEYLFRHSTPKSSYRPKSRRKSG
jgi:hypothetical protein